MGSQRAYLLVEVKVGKAREVLGALQNLKGVESANPVTGPFDIIALLAGKTLQEVSRVVTDEIHAIEGIARTITCVIPN
jgi:DNA-binding Lrp family transcriptional regulator